MAEGKMMDHEHSRMMVEVFEAAAQDIVGKMVDVFDNAMQDFVDRISGRFHHVLDSVSDEFAETQELAQRPHVLMRPKVYRYDHKWHCLYGDNTHDGVYGNGETPEEACSNFDEAWWNGVKKPAGESETEMEPMVRVYPPPGRLGSGEVRELCDAKDLILDILDALDEKRNPNGKGEKP